MIFVSWLDRGVIKNLRHYYRKRVVMRYLSNFESGVKKDINLLESILEIHNAWNSVKSCTIKNCFTKGSLSPIHGVVLPRSHNKEFHDLVWPEFQVTTKNYDFL